MGRAAFLLTAFFLVQPEVRACAAESGPGTAALVELYTSEGCSSCPPAERWLAGLGKRYPAGTVVSLALHVDYRDYIGGSDSYARQKTLSPLQRLALVYTPRVLLQGRDFRDWGTKAFDEALSRINDQPAKARLKLELLGADAKGLQVQASAELVEPVADAVLYLAAYQSRLESRVSAGENRGRILTHDYVVLEWQGPFGFSKETRLTRRLALLPGAAAANSGAAALVQNRRTGEVLQALLRAAC